MSDPTSGHSRRSWPSMTPRWESWPQSCRHGTTTARSSDFRRDRRGWPWSHDHRPDVISYSSKTSKTEIRVETSPCGTGCRVLWVEYGRVGFLVDSEIVLSTRYGKSRVFINKSLSTETSYQQDLMNRDRWFCRPHQVNPMMVVSRRFPRKSVCTSSKEFTHFAPRT